MNKDAGFSRKYMDGYEPPNARKAPEPGFFPSDGHGRQSTPIHSGAACEVQTYAEFTANYRTFRHFNVLLPPNPPDQGESSDDEPAVPDHPLAFFDQTAP